MNRFGHAIFKPLTVSSKSIHVVKEKRCSPYLHARFLIGPCWRLPRHRPGQVGPSSLRASAGIHWNVTTVRLAVDTVSNSVGADFGLRYKESAMKRIFFTTLVFLGLCLMLGGVVMADRERAAGEVLSQHMVAEAMLTAHFIDAALKAGMSRDEINAVLARVAERSAIAEFWISDEEGRIEFSNVKGAKFRFPTDSAAKTQTAPLRRPPRRRQDRCRPRASGRASWMARSSNTSASRGSTSPGSFRLACPRPGRTRVDKALNHG